MLQSVVLDQTLLNSIFLEFILKFIFFQLCTDDRFCASWIMNDALEMDDRDLVNSTVIEYFDCMTL